MVQVEREARVGGRGGRFGEAMRRGAGWALWGGQVLGVRAQAEARGGQRHA